MGKNEYLFAVAAVRAREGRLLREADLSALISAQSYKAAAALLESKGFPIDKDDTDFSKYLDKSLSDTWEFLLSCAGGEPLLDTFVLKNDFHNIKAALKCEFAGRDAESLLLSPCTVPKALVLEAVRERAFDRLPLSMAAAAKEAYTVIIETGNGQAADILLDTAALNAIYESAKTKNSVLLEKYAALYCDAADCKTAYRCIMAGKSKTFTEKALCGCGRLSKEAMVKAVLKGENALSELLKSSGYADFSDALQVGMSEFEKQCDNALLQCVKVSAMTAFGIEPLAAYYLARETEIKCVRIILAAKLNGTPEATVRERMRTLYV